MIIDKQEVVGNAIVMILTVKSIVIIKPAVAAIVLAA